MPQGAPENPRVYSAVIEHHLQVVQRKWEVYQGYDPPGVCVFKDACNVSPICDGGGGLSHVDRDTVVNALQTSHDLHLLKIDSREDDMISKIKNWLSTMIEQIHDEEEYKRNRKRVMEINRLVDYLRDEIYEPADLQEQ